MLLTEFRLSRRKLPAGQDSLRLVTNPAVLAGYALKSASLPAPWDDPARTLTLPDFAAMGAPASEEMFTLGGEKLPCFLPQDVDANDPWLLGPQYYPLYFSLFKWMAEKKQGPLRLLEIGVRTGYMAAVFARATAEKGGEYLGIDPNLYLANGLKLALATTRKLERPYPKFRHQFIQGYSSADIFQQNLQLLGPFDVIHIDGDHSMAGKVIDAELGRRLIAPGGLVLLDDFNHAPSVRQSVAIAMHLGWYRHVAVVPTLRGMAVLTVE